MQVMSSEGQQLRDAANGKLAKRQRCDAGEDGRWHRNREGGNNSRKHHLAAHSNRGDANVSNNYGG